MSGEERAAAPQYESKHERMCRIRAETVRNNAERAKREAAFRMSDELERAKLYLRQNGWNVFEASIVHPNMRNRWFVGQSTHDRAGVIDFAKRRGWKG